jgi:outer membrane protein OmpA-like peptidoglycan-associated protein
MKRVTPAISKGIAENKETMIDALYPIMGGMISKYVTQAIKEMMETINKKIENGLSFERYKRKAKAKLTGVSETEILLEESNEATIASLFVIQKESSLLIAEAHLKNKEIDDAHMVASMASAIKDFINDWAQNNDMGSEVQILSYGNATLYIESAGSVFLVAFLDAEPNYEQRIDMNKFFASILKEYSDFFQDFDGDDSAQEIVQLSMKLEDYLYAHAPKHLSDRGKKKRNPAKYILISIVLLIFAYGIYLFSIWYEERKLEQTIYMQTKEKISIEKNDDTLVLNGQISSLEKIANIRSVINHYIKNAHIQNNLTVPISYLDERFRVLNRMNKNSIKSMNEKFKLLERSSTIAIDSLNEKLLKLHQLLEETKDEWSKKVILKNQVISTFKKRREQLKQIIDIKTEIYYKLDKLFDGDAVYVAKEHALDFKTLNLFHANETQYQKDVMLKLSNTFEKYIRVLVPYLEYIKNIQIEGHSDSSGIEKDNIILSKKRALNVKEYLSQLPIVKQHHIDNLMHAYGYGSRAKIVHNGIEDKNASRRIKIKFELNNVTIINKLREKIE